MTTIAYRDGILATDSLLTAAGRKGGTVSKITRAATGHLFAWCGCAYAAERLHRHFAEIEHESQLFPLPLREDDDGEGLLVCPDGTVRILACDGDLLTLEADFHAHGSGGYYALGAMFHGASAIQAVRAGIALDTMSGGEVRWAALSDDHARAAGLVE